jgi:hypothetical protein
VRETFKPKLGSVELAMFLLVRLFSPEFKILELRMADEPAGVK